MTETSSGTPGLVEEATKECSICGQEKAFESFNKRSASKDGLEAKCKSCKADYTKAWNSANNDLRNEYSRAWRDRNKDKVSSYNNQYKRANKGIVNESIARRAAIKKRSEVSACQEERQKIQELYWLAKDLKAVSGQDYHVDHIIPLAKGGEHRLHNLQILPADMNLAKSDKL